MKYLYAIAVVALSVAACVGNVIAATVSATITFSEEDFDFSQPVVDNVTYDHISCDGGKDYAVTPGYPTLPVVNYSVSIPYGSTITAVETTSSNSEVLEGDFYVYPAQEPIRTTTDLEFDYRNAPDWDEPWEFTAPDEDLYSSSDLWPSNILVNNGHGVSRGYLLQDFSLFPFQWTADDKELKLYTSVTVRVTYTPPGSPPTATRYEWPNLYDMWGDAVKACVLNPEDVYDDREPVIAVDVMEGGVDAQGVPFVTAAESAYYAYNIPDSVTAYSDPNDKEYPFAFVIITNDKWWYGDGANDYVNQPDLINELGPVVEWTMLKGFPTLLVKVDDIVNNVSGDDKQDKIRNFLIQAHQKWGTYGAFFVGDSAAPTGDYSTAWGRYGVVPSRHVCESAGYYVHPSDFYYSCLGGSWGPIPDSSTGYFGSLSDDLILKPTIAVGRVPVGDRNPLAVPGQDKIETANWVAKFLKYEQDPESGYADKVLLLGSDYGCAECKALVADGYFPGYAATHMYEGTAGEGVNNADPYVDYPTYPEPHQIADGIGSGYGITIMGSHGAPLCNYVITQGNNDPGVYTQEFTADEGVPVQYANYMMYGSGMKDFDCNGKYGILNTTSCSTFRYDYSDNESKECVGEQYLTSADGGGIAYLGNTTLGYVGGSNDLAKNFLKNLMNKTETPSDDIFALGVAHAFARSEYCAGKPQHVAYACNLGGDPLTTVWTDDPASLTVTYDSWKDDDTYTLEVTVKDASNNAVSAARVTLWVADTFYLINKTGDSGTAKFTELTPFTAGKLTTWKHNYIPISYDDVEVQEE